MDDHRRLVSRSSEANLAQIFACDRPRVSTSSSLALRSVSRIGFSPPIRRRIFLGSGFIDLPHPDLAAAVGLSREAAMTLGGARSERAPTTFTHV